MRSDEQRIVFVALDYIRRVEVGNGLFTTMCLQLSRYQSTARCLIMLNYKVHETEEFSTNMDFVATPVGAV